MEEKKKNITKLRVKEIFLPKCLCYLKNISKHHCKKEIILLIFTTKHDMIKNMR